MTSILVRITAFLKEKKKKKGKKQSYSFKLISWSGDTEYETLVYGSANVGVFYAKHEQVGAELGSMGIFKQSFQNEA